MQRLITSGIGRCTLGKNALIVVLSVALLAAVAALVRRPPAAVPAITAHRSAESAPITPPQEPPPDMGPLRDEIRQLRGEVRALHEVLSRGGAAAPGPVEPSVPKGPAPHASRTLAQLHEIRRYEAMVLELGDPPTESLARVRKETPLSAAEHRAARLELAVGLLDLADPAGFVAGVERACDRLKGFRAEPGWSADAEERELAAFDRFLDPEDLRHRYFRENLLDWIEDLIEE